MRWVLGAKVLLLLLAAGVPALAQATIAVTFALPRQGLSFGEAFDLEVVRTWPLSVDCGPFDERALAPLSAQLVGTQAWPATGSATNRPGGDRWQYRAYAYAPGVLQLPPVELLARGVDGRAVVLATCTPAPLVVRSVLQEPPGDIEWPADVRDMPRVSLSLWWVAAALVVVLVGGGLWSRSRRPQAAASPAVATAAAPHTIALSQLETLPMPGDDAPAIEAFYTQLADIVREHSERRFAVRAAVCTSQELVRCVPLGTEPLQHCLLACDLVKFAARRPVAAEHTAARRGAVAYVHATVVAGPAP